MSLAFAILFGWLAALAICAYSSKIEQLRTTEKSLNVFTWGDMLSPAMVQQFEKETGIKVRLSYYSSNEELLVKLKATKGEGYDLIIPSDYAVKVLIDEGLLQELDRSKLPFFSELNPKLLGHFFDKENSYSIPFQWELFGLGIDKDYFATHPFSPSWRSVFDQKVIDYKITMINDPVETVLIASFYLFGKIFPLTKTQASAVTTLLKEQRSSVLAYADFRGDYFLATQNCPLIVSSSSYVTRSQEKFPFIEFVIPEEGTFLTIENLAIPKNSNKQELVYQLIDYLYREESIRTAFGTYKFLPVLKNSNPIFGDDKGSRRIYDYANENFDRLHFTEMIVPEEELRDLWIEVKSG